MQMEAANQDRRTIHRKVPEQPDAGEPTFEELVAAPVAGGPPGDHRAERGEDKKARDDEAE